MRGRAGGRFTQRAGRGIPADRGGISRGTTRRLTIHIPVPHVPRFDGDGIFEYPRESVVNTVVIEVPTVSELAAILQPEPDPVNPSFTEEEEEPVLDALGGGGSDRAFATGQEPRVLEAPLAILRRRPPHGSRRRPAPTPPVLQHRWGHKRRRASRPRFAGHPCRRPQSRRRASPPRGELHRPGRVTTPTCAPRRPPTWPSWHCRASRD